MKLSLHEIVLIALILCCVLNIIYPVLPFWILLLISFIYLHFLVVGAAVIRFNIFVKSLNAVSEFPAFNEINTANDKRLCLTFDDGIHPIHTVKCLDLLRAQNVRAHFFVIGKNISGNESILKRMHDEGHVIGNHSFQHSWHFDLLGSKAMQAEIEQTNQLICSILGQSPRLFRPPYGVTNPNLARAIRKTGMISMGWNLRSFDTVAKNRNELLQRLIKKTRPNSLILLHDRCEVTLQVLTDYIEYCQLEGYTFVTLKSTDEN